ncbi:hypothetical protein HDF17_002909 [Granulicella arctica]|uniref:Uncharacterized protein n=1 Tax=Granulicella arctica TaxID=940613 RepID=A0A7Y9THJ0_9BACT|nr:hypothetical protein [Granulicella arctica]
MDPGELRTPGDRLACVSHLFGHDKDIGKTSSECRTSPDCGQFNASSSDSLRFSSAYSRAVVILRDQGCGLFSSINATVVMAARLKVGCGWTRGRPRYEEVKAATSSLGILKVASSVRLFTMQILSCRSAWFFEDGGWLLSRGASERCWRCLLFHNVTLLMECLASSVSVFFLSHLNEPRPCRP